MNDTNILTELSPTSASIVDQTDEILNDDKKRKLNTDIENTGDDLGFDFDDTKETYRTTVDAPKVKEDIVLEKKVDDKKRILSTDISESIVKSKEDIKNENFIISESLLLKDEETEFDFWRLHPAISENEDLPMVFQQEFADWYFNQAMGLETGELRPVQSPLFELSVAQGGRNIIQGLLDFKSFVSPFYGGDSWWNGFGKGPGDFPDRIDPKGKEAILLPNLRTPGG